MLAITSAWADVLSRGWITVFAPLKSLGALDPVRYALSSCGGCSSVAEHELPKLGVEGSIPFTRSGFHRLHYP